MYCSLCTSTSLNKVPHLAFSIYVEGSRVQFSVYQHTYTHIQPHMHLKKYSLRHAKAQKQSLIPQRNKKAQLRKTKTNKSQSDKKIKNQDK